MTAPLIEARNLVQTYEMRTGMIAKPVRVRAVNDVSLKIEKGETVGLIGESGCGKSTTGRLLAGLEKGTSGTVAFLGAPMPSAEDEEWRQLRKRIQVVFQDPLGSLDQRLPIGRQVAEPLKIHRLAGAADLPGHVGRLLAAVGLDASLASRYPHELSGGQRQRAVLARALATDPDLLICDEPIAALDISVQAQVINLLTDLQAERGMGMLFISHDLRAVRQICHRVAVMYLGQIIEEGPPDAVFQAPRHPYTKALVSAMPRRNGRGAGRIVLQGDLPNPADRPRGCVFQPRCASATSLCSEQAPGLSAAMDGRSVACHHAAGTQGANQETAL